MQKRTYFEAAPPPSVNSKPRAIKPAPESDHERAGRFPSVDESLLLSLLPDYCALVFPASPIVDENGVRESISRLRNNRDDAAFAYAYAAVTVCLTPPKEYLDASPLIADLVSRALEARSPIIHHRDLSIRRIMTSAFVRICFGFLQEVEMEFVYLREAITMLELLHLQHSSEGSQMDFRDRVTLERLHWVLFIHERNFVIAHEVQPLLTVPPPSPENASDLPRHVREGFDRLIALYSLLDEDFFRNWREKDESPLLTLEWIEGKQTELNQQLEKLQVAQSILSEIQRADLIVTGQWIRTLVWQMAMSKHLLSSVAAQDYMLLLFPVQRSAYLRRVLEKISRQSLEQQGRSIFQKLFELINTAADVVSLAGQFGNDEDMINWRDDCVYLIHYLQDFRGLDPMLEKILREKLQALESLQLTDLHAGSPVTRDHGSVMPW
ncbi:uncharacterized protein Z518_08483 [Rhinocladiella mackenziei CBS 650.93]|uniref:Transcription factor domain-containing protein n=1 Tax=Rhinocladiella mackenziei CBS 650.93 TaxID=1442369 RepID=A0A0D2FKU9_9EURO|nr:uncharacterized protein Z518_08483 [Rhinocladiella mackenziei CBS 650.93]KIX02542.1 hypothetical protein Z518_08483 [Rhinocladiella mackenziei CBS 650.93]